MIKTVTLPGTEVTVDGLGGFNTVVHNMSGETVYASKYPNVTAGADNVAEIPAGAVKLLSTTNGKVYLVGSGRVELTGQDYEGINYSSPAAPEIVVGGSGVTEQFVTEHDDLNLEKAKSYADGILEKAVDSLERQLSQSSDSISQMNEDISSLRSAVAAAEDKAEAALDAAEDIAAKSIVSEEGAFDLRFYDYKLQAKMGGGWSDITTGGGEGGGVSQAYVDDRDVAALAAAKEYADSKIADAVEAAEGALKAAKEYTDTVAADKADKPINTFVIIGTENWENDGEEYPYYYDIPIEGAASAKCAEVFFAADSEEAAKKCEFSTEVTVSDGAVQIRAKHIPETILSANVQIGVLSATNTLHIYDTKSVVGEGVEEHNADLEAHPDIRDSIRELKEQIDGEIAQSIEEHDADHAAHPDLRAKLNELKGRIVALEVAAGGDINANPFAVTFGDLDGVIADGVWVPASARLEF